MRFATLLGLAFVVTAGVACDSTPTKPKDAAPTASSKSSSTGAAPSPTLGPTASSAPDARPAPASTIAASTACDTLDRKECLGANHCTLHHVAESKYECRDSKGPCEENLMQGDRVTCEKRDGCEWKPGSCYCPFPGYGSAKVPDKDENSGGACACGGGPPPLCKKKA